ncbi:hypothetical protein [Methanoregula sp.]|uniref:hypothetical protein n=1 Tax=Methanoregula sp. TaxID=2052170 RepID=UPI00356890FF
MAKEPLFFKDEGAMGDVFEVAKQIVEQTRLSRENRARVASVTEERMKQLTGKFIEYDTINAQSNEYRIKIHQLRVKLLKGELSPEEAKAALLNLAQERESLQAKYAGMVELLDGQMKNIDAELVSLDEREALLARQRDQYHSALHMEVKWLAEGELKEIAGLRESLKKKRASLVEEKGMIFTRKEELAESFSLVEDVIGQKRTRYVSAENARASELNFLARFDMKMNAYPVKIFSPHEGMTYTVTSWNRHNHYDAGQASSAGGAIPATALPVNAGSVYAIEHRDLKYLGRSRPKVIAEAFSYCNLSDYADLGFDTRPVTLPALMGVLHPIIHQAEAGDYYHVLGIASPTGWDEGVIAWATGGDGGASYASRNVAVCLIDSVIGEIYYNRNDNRILSYVDYFRHEFDRERVDTIKAVIRAEFEPVEYLEFEKILETTKEDRFIIQLAFYELEREKAGRIKFVQGVGMVFMR